MRRPVAAGQPPEATGGQLQDLIGERHKKRDAVYLTASRLVFSRASSLLQKATIPL
ncbi:hypothetical protein EMIT048CA2_330006 [Pseudomonas chlororaphis]